MLDFLKARRPKTTGQAPKPHGAKHQILIQVDGDGFIPAIQFQGSDLKALLVQSTWAYSCITRIAEDLASMPGVVQVRDGQSWRTDPDHEANSLIRRPFGLDPSLPPWSWAQMMKAAAMHTQLKGNAFALQVHPTGSTKRLVALQLMVPTQVRVTEANTGAAELYHYGGQTYTPDQVVNMMVGYPTTYWKGTPPMDAAQRPIAVDYYAHERIAFDLSQRLAPGMIVKVAGMYGLDDEDRTEIEDYLTSAFSKTEQTGKPLVLGESTEIEQSPTPTYLADLPIHRDKARDEILSIFRVPPPVAGIFDAATLQNAQVALRLYWMQAIQPLITTLLDAVNTQAIQPTYGKDTRFWYELADNELGLAILKERASIAESLTRIGHSANDASDRVGLGMPTREELDTPNTEIVKAGRSSTTATSSTTDAPPAPAVDAAGS